MRNNTCRALQEEDSGSSTVSINMTRTPIPGHISSLRAAEQEQKRTDTLKDASKKHIDPFTGKEDFILRSSHILCLQCLWLHGKEKKFNLTLKLINPSDLILIS
jgi:hypothetical protein